MEWNAQAFMYIAIGIFFLAFGAGVAVALFRLSHTLKQTTAILADVNTRVIPLLTRVETTLDNVNSELGTISEITDSAAVMVKTAENTTTAVYRGVSTPLRKAAGVAAGVSEGVGTFLFGKQKEA